MYVLADIANLADYWDWMDLHQLFIIIFLQFVALYLTLKSYMRVSLCLV